MESPCKLSGPREHIYTTDPHTWDKLKVYARENRKNTTPAENLLWQKLRGPKQGMKFRRQRAIGFFTVDFICVAAKLIIEAEGEFASLQSRPNTTRAVPSR